MKRTAIFLVVVLVISMFALSSCELLGKIPVIGDLINKPCESHVDADNDYVCDNCGERLQHDDPQPEPNCECLDEDGDHKCDKCGATYSSHVDSDQNHNCDICGEPLTECADADTDHKCDKCGADVGEHIAAEGSHNCGYCGVAVSECAAAEGSHNCSVCGAVLSECVDENGDYACDICGKENLPENLERVNYSLNISGQEATTLESDAIFGKFTIVAGSTIRNRTKTFEGVEYTQSVKIGDKTTAIKVDVPGTGKLSFLIQNGSSGAAMQFVTVTAPDGTVYDIEFLGTDGGSPVVKIDVDVTAGEWIISRGKNGGTQDIFYLELSCIVEKSDENGFELVSEGTVDYLCGQSLDLSGLKLNGTYANGKTEPLSLEDVTIDDSLVNLGQSGTYPLTINYKNYEPIVVNINVYLPVSVELDFDGTVQGSQTSAGNGTYVNQSFKEVYAVGEDLDITGLYVSVVGSLGEDNTKTFANISDYAYSYNELVAGANTITVKYVFGAEEVLATTTVYVVDTAPSIVEDAYQVKVDQSYTGTIGAVVDGYNMFTTVQQALDFLASSEAGKRKIMIIEEGLYTEKIEITIPNLHIKGVGSDKVVIEWDSLYGIKDAGGYSQVTDSTQTVAIRDSAYGVTIEGVTISNYWNSQERMDEAGLGIERGLALLVQADRFIMRDSALLGIQDTLELFTGRQYFENVFISGYTDFIFGTNNTTLFKNCTIHVIDTVKDDSGTAGYITAFKGSNKGASDAITYGAIFYQCKFTADEGVMEGKTAIGRTWGAYAAVAVIESELGGHISVDAYDSSNNKNKRYISMNGIHPTDETVQFVEYGNTGAGAISEAVAGMKMLTAEEAALYIDIATIFGKNNRGVSWLDAWDPAVTEILLDDRTYYNFDQSTSEGTCHIFDTNTTIASGSTLEWEGILISAENGKVAWNANANALNMKAGAFIKFTVPAGTEVTVVTYPNYNYFTLNGVGTASANMLSQYYAEETEVTLLSTGDLYIYQIIINPDEEAPEAPTLNEIKVSGFNTNYVVGDEISLEGVSVKGIYSDNSVLEVSYEVDSSAVVNTAAGEYEVIFSFDGKTVSVTVTYEDPNASPAITKDTVLDFTTPEGLEAVQNNPKVTIEGSVRHNGAEIQITGTISFQVKAGTVITVIPYANSQYASYKLYAEDETSDIVLNEMYSMMFFEDCTVVYEGLDNNYLCQILIECPLSEGKYVFGGSTVEGDVTGILESIPGLSITGTCKTHSGGAQLGADSQIIFIAPALATVTIQGFDTNYGQLLVLVDGEPVEMNANAQYVINCISPSTIIIEAKNVGTDEAPAWNKSYITYIDVAVPEIIEENTEITFGSEGNYKDSVVDFSGITIGDNGGNNSQIKNGSFSFAVREGAVVTVHGYSGYTSYNLGDGDITFEGLTDEYFTYEAWSDCVITISHTEGNNYFYSVSIVYPVVFEENTTIDLSATGANIQGATGIYEGLEINATNGKFADNNGGWTQVNSGTIIKLNVLEGAEVSVSAYSSADNFTVEILDGVCTITCVGNDYLKAISVKYPVVYSEATTIDLSATGANIQGATGIYEGLDIDATNGKFADNNGGWVQVNTGTIIKLNVADGAQVSVSAYSSAANFTVEIASGVCTITAVGNDYLNAITVSYPVSYDAAIDNEFVSDKDNTLNLVFAPGGAWGIATNGSHKVEVANGSPESGAIGGLDAAGKYVYYEFVMSEAGVVDFIWNIAGSNWDGSGNAGLEDMAAHMTVTIDGTPVDVSGIALAAEGDYPWWNLQNIVIKNVALEAGIHTFKCDITAAGGLNVGSMTINSSKELSVRSADVTNAKVSVEGDKVYYVFTLTNNGFTADEIKFWHNSSTSYEIASFETVDGVTTLKIDVTDLAVGTQIDPHLSFAGANYVNDGNLNGDVRGGNLAYKQDYVVVNGKTYNIFEYYSMPSLIVGAESYMRIRSADIYEEEGKLYYTLTYFVANYDPSTFEFFDGETIYEIESYDVDGGLVTFKFNLTDKAAGFELWPHLRVDGNKWDGANNTSSSNGDVKVSVTTETITFNGKVYTLKAQWSMPTVVVTAE